MRALSPNCQQPQSIIHLTSTMLEYNNFAYSLKIIMRNARTYCRCKGLEVIKRERERERFLIAFSFYMQTITPFSKREETPFLGTHKQRHKVPTSSNVLEP